MLWATRGSCVHGEGRGGSLIVIRNEVQAQEKTGKFGMVVRKTRAALQFPSGCRVPKSLFMEDVKIFQQNLNPGE